MMRPPPSLASSSSPRLLFSSRRLPGSSGPWLCWEALRLLAQGCALRSMASGLFPTVSRATELRAPPRKSLKISPRNSKP